jgi:hypothetical protein
MRQLLALLACGVVACGPSTGDDAFEDATLIVVPGDVVLTIENGAAAGSRTRRSCAAPTASSRW